MGTSSGSSCRWVRPWRRARASIASRLSLEGRLVVAFVLLTLLGLGTASLMFLRQGQKRVGDLIGEQARQIALTLSLASENVMDEARLDGLDATAHALIRSRNILFVAFHDAEGRVVSLASRDVELKPEALRLSEGAVLELMQLRSAHSPVFGAYQRVTAPVLATPAPGERRTGVLGYVSVGVSLSAEEAQLRVLNATALIIGGGICMLSAPLTIVIVRRVLVPVRHLVAATRRIAAGDLDAHVDVNRRDAIGDLARSFNEMARRVRLQQEELAAANRDLERKVEERTAQLETANGRLRAEIAEKEDFLRAVSHDLNAPLRNIAGMAGMLLVKHRDGLNDEVIHRLERIQSNVEMETSLINELLELSRIKTRRLKMERVDVAALVEQLRGVFEDDLQAKRIALIVETPLPALRAEPIRVRQVFQNLIDNAIKYMGDGERREIRVGCLVRSGEVEFYVRDTGLGIDAEDLERVFHVFRRGRNAAGNGVAGRGVGLASVKSIVETYSGRIWVESAPGAGSAFRFTVNGEHVERAAQAA